MLQFLPAKGWVFAGEASPIHEVLDYRRAARGATLTSAEHQRFLQVIPDLDAMAL
jgi:hypothetical protein